MMDTLSFFFLLIVCILGTYALTPAIKRFVAYRNGYSKGHTEGREEGFNSGYADGLSDGIVIGERRKECNCKGTYIDARG